MRWLPVLPHALLILPPPPATPTLHSSDEALCRMFEDGQQDVFELLAARWLKRGDASQVGHGHVGRGAMHFLCCSIWGSCMAGRGRPVSGIALQPSMPHCHNHRLPPVPPAHGRPRS